MSKQQKGKTEKQRHRVQNSPADPAGVVNGPRDSGSQTNAKNKIERPFLCDLEIRISFDLARPGRTNEATMNGRKNELG
jgi:hypothetical protein